jgi:UDP-N-acetylglucosamine--N-acetylmuramyl-(pentapeptide) pyrophosphoryl-undecaprenol N-acetylglucosamine transferase
MPMIAVGEAYAEYCPGARIIALGQSGGLEASLLPARGFAFHGVDAAPLFGAATPAGLAAAAGGLYRGFRQARRILAAASAEIVIGFGGYVTAGPLLAARSLGLATIIFEANVIPGRANRLLRRFADICTVGQQETSAFRGWAEARVVGHPIRQEIAELGRSDRDGLGLLHILVTGGSLGSAFLDRVCPSLCANVAAGGRRVTVLHQSCPEHANAVTRSYADAGVTAEVRPFLDMVAAYRAAQLVICAAGAGTLAEIETLGLRALVVPIETVADGHQAANAKAFSARSALPSLRESQWHDARAAALVSELLAKPPDHAGTAPRLHTRAARNLVEVCEELLAVKQVRRAAARPMARSVRSARS